MPDRDAERGEWIGVGVQPTHRTKGSATFYCFQHKINEHHTSWDHASLAATDHINNSEHESRWGVSHYTWESVTMGIVRMMWENMDQRMDALQSLRAAAKEPGYVADEADDTAQLMISRELKAQAELVCLFMSVQHNTPEKVAREVLDRWKARQRGEERVTFGLVGRIYEPVPGEIQGLGNKPRAVRIEEAEKELLASADRKTDADDRATIVESVMDETMTPVEVSQFFSLTVAEVKALVARHKRQTARVEGTEEPINVDSYGNEFTPESHALSLQMQAKGANTDPGYQTETFDPQYAAEVKAADHNPDAWTAEQAAAARSAS